MYCLYEYQSIPVSAVSEAGYLHHHMPTSDGEQALGQPTLMDQNSEHDHSDDQSDTNHLPDHYNYLFILIE